MHKQQDFFGCLAKILGCLGLREAANLEIWPLRPRRGQKGQSSKVGSLEKALGQPKIEARPPKRSRCICIQYNRWFCCIFGQRFMPSHHQSLSSSVGTLQIDTAKGQWKYIRKPALWQKIQVFGFIMTANLYWCEFQKITSVMAFIWMLIIGQLKHVILTKKRFQLCLVEKWGKNNSKLSIKTFCFCSYFNAIFCTDKVCNLDEKNFSNVHGRHSQKISSK